jgi:hypothetical protein
VNDRTKDQCRRIVEQYNARLTATRGDKRLSEAGRKADIAADHEKTKAELAEIKHAAAEQTEARRKQLAQRLFGVRPGESGSDLVAYRDAQDRAGKASTAAALGELMEAADVANDKTLLRAAAARAHTLGGGLVGESFRGLVQAYVGDVGGQAVADLDEHDRLTSSSSMTQRTIEGMETSIAKPSELTDRHVADDTDPGPQPGDYRTASGWVRGNG